MMEKITQKQFKNEVEVKNLALIGATMNVSASFINKLFAAIEAGEPSKLKISSSLIAKAHFTSSQYMKRGESFLYLKGYKQGIIKVPSGTKSVLTHILGNMSNHKYPV